LEADKAHFAISSLRIKTTPWRLFFLGAGN
jgi:hypothetical protein